MKKWDGDMQRARGFGNDGGVVAISSRNYNQPYWEGNIWERLEVVERVKPEDILRTSFQAVGKIGREALGWEWILLEE